MMTIPYALLKLSTPTKPVNPSFLRGFIGERFKENDLVHNHREDGSNIYRYPLVQYKKIENQYLLAALKKEGVAVLKQFFLELEEITIKDQRLEILSKEMKVMNHEIRIENTMQFQYEFQTPYIALNQKNTVLYHNQDNKKEFLDRMISNNILSFLKGMNIFIDERIQCRFIQTDRFFQTIKDNDFTAFSGFFSANIDLPDYIGLGKFVSRGFGTIIKIN